MAGRLIRAAGMGILLVTIAALSFAVVSASPQVIKYPPHGSSTQVAYFDDQTVCGTNWGFRHSSNIYAWSSQDKIDVYQNTLDLPYVFPTPPFQLYWWVAYLYGSGPTQVITSFWGTQFPQYTVWYYSGLTFDYTPSVPGVRLETNIGEFAYSDACNGGTTRLILMGPNT